MAREVKYDWFYNLDNDVFATYDTVNYELRGYDGNDRLFGNDGDDLLLGGDGNDSLFGGDGDDEMQGGAGDDVFFIDRGNDSYIGGTGSDTLSFKQAHVLTSLTPWGSVLGQSANISDYANGFNFDAESGATFAFSTATQGFTDNWGTKTLSTGVNAIEMTNSTDILRDSDQGHRLYGRGGNDKIEGRGGADLIDGGLGSDWASYESSGMFGLRTGVVVDLESNTGLFNDAEGDTFSSIENVLGSAFRDTLRGNSADNWLDGGAENDVLDGNGGRDILFGRGGNDTFQFRELADSTVDVSSRDRIVDFQTGDKIDLSLIDAKVTPPFSLNNLGDQAFSFIGTADFTGRAGDLRAVSVNEPGFSFTLVSGDVNGDRIADFAIEVFPANGVFAPTLGAGDFIL